MACTTRGPTPMGSTTARRRSWVACRCATRTSSTFPTGWCSSCGSRARTRSAWPTSSCWTTATAWTCARAVTSRLVRFRDGAGRETTLSSRRFVSMAHPHLAGIEWTLTAHNWSGRVEVISAIDGRVTNRGVARYLELEGRHLDPVVAANVRPRSHRAEGRDPPVRTCTSAKRRGRGSSTVGSR